MTSVLLFYFFSFFFLLNTRTPNSTPLSSSAAADVDKEKVIQKKKTKIQGIFIKNDEQSRNIHYKKKHEHAIKVCTDIEYKLNTSSYKTHRAHQYKTKLVSRILP